MISYKVKKVAVNTLLGVFVSYFRFIMHLDNSAFDCSYVYAWFIFLRQILLSSHI